MVFSILVIAGFYRYGLVGLAVSIAVIALLVQRRAILGSHVGRRFAVPAKESQTSDRIMHATASLQDHGQIVVAIANADFSELLYVSRAYQAIWGRTLESLYAEPRSALDGVHPEDRGQVKECVRRLIGGEPIDHLECRIVRPDGSICWIAYRWFPIRDAGGDVCRFWGSAQDITERKDMEEELRRTRRRTEFVLDSVTDMHMLIDRSWNLLSVNEAAIRSIGRPREQVVGRSFWEIFPYIVGTELERQYRRAMDGDLPGAFDFHCPKYDAWWQTRFYTAPEGVAIFAVGITARKRAEDRLREYEKVVESLQEMIVVVERRHGEREYRYVLANRRYLELRGGERKQFVGQPVPSMVGAEDYDRIFKPKLDECFQGNVVHFEITRNYPQIGDRDLNVSYFPIDGPHGVRKAVCVMQDVTERKRADAAIRQERDRAQLYLDIADVILLALDLDGRVTLINRKGCSALGREESELLGQDWVDTCIPERMRDQLRASFRNLIGGDLSHIENPILTKSGEERTIGWHNTVMRDAEGRVTGTLSSGEDITERKRAEEALTRFRTLIDQFDDAVEIIDVDTLRFLDINQKACTDRGYTREELLSHTVFDIDPTVDRETYSRVAKQLRESGSVIREGIHLRKDGSAFPVENHIKLIQLETGGYVVAVSRDITERKRAEEELRRLSGQILRSQDEERRRIARGLHDSTGQDFVALAAYLAQLQASIPSSCRESRKLSALCQSLAERCIREVRTLSYLLHPPMLDEAGLEDAIRHYADGLAERIGIKVALEISPRFKRMTPDIEVALFRVVQESLTNIQRHSGSREARIRILRDPGKITLDVIDKGAGIPGSKRRQNGELPLRFGVGIPSMQERVKLIGGQFEIESSRRGTTVRVTIPVNE
jgi:PAS domain S-box-containing protein